MVGRHRQAAMRSCSLFTSLQTHMSRAARGCIVHAGCAHMKRPGVAATISFYPRLTGLGLQFACVPLCSLCPPLPLPLSSPPLQDVILVSNCCGDCCGFAPKGSPWQVHIQTAGSSIANGGRAGAELVVMCLQSPEEFRSQVLAAKRRAADPAAMAAYARTGASAGAASGVSVGAGKEGGGAGGIELRSGSGGGGGDNAAVVAVLERIERALNEGIALAASRSGGAGVASAGAGGAPASYGGGAALSGLGGVYPSTGAGR